MVTRLGIIGISEGNGHPFSFSAIINGYSDAGMDASGWPGIHEYVKRRDPSEFGFEGFRVTHAWTQDPEVTKKLCKACLIPNPVTKPEEMIGSVDAVIIARDDYETHFRMAIPFLKAGMHVFVDKPLSLDIEELNKFWPYVESGKLMSCAGMRYARELDEPRASLSDYGEIMLVRGAILNSWEKYGVHMLDAIFNTVRSRPISVFSVAGRHNSLTILMDDASLVQIDALGDIGKCFRVDIFGTKKITSHEITDNFSMFRRLLWHFINSIKSSTPAIPPEQVRTIMKLLIAGRKAITEERKVSLDEIRI